MRLEVYDGSGNEYGKADYWIQDSQKPKDQWQTLDFMFTEDTGKPYKIEKMNHYLAATPNKKPSHKPHKPPLMTEQTA